MDAIEQAIRNAFAKGDPEDPAFREKVYRWAYSVVDKAIQAKANLSPEDAERQRRRALAAIEKVESEFQPAEAAEVPVSAAPAAVEPATRSPEPDNAAPVPEIDQRPATGSAPVPEVGAVVAGPASDSRRDPAPIGSDAERGDWPDLGDAPSRSPTAGPLAGDPVAPQGRRAELPVDDKPRRKLPWGLIGGLFILLIVVVLAIWTAAELGFLGRPSNTASPADGGQNAGTPGMDQQRSLEDWIVVFSPNDPTTARAPSGAQAEVAGEGETQVMRISSGTSGAGVAFDIGVGVLERIAGRRAIFDIVAQTGEGPETQMSVSCNLGELGECGRNRYQVGKQQAEFLFEVDIPDGAPSSPGAIVVIPDVDNGGKAVEILEIRVTTADATN